MKLIELYKEIQKLETPFTRNPLFYFGIPYSPYTFLEEYYDENENLMHIDLLLLKKYGNREFDPILDNIVDSWRECVRGYIYSRGYNLQRVWDAMHLEYNPIENYSKNSKTEVEHIGDVLIKSGSESTKLSFNGSENHRILKGGQEISELSKSGEESNTLEYSGVEKDTNTKSGGEVKTTNYGEREKTIKNSTVPWNEASESEHSKSIENNAEVEDSESIDYNSVKNESEITFTNRKDTTKTTFTNRKDTNTTTFNNREDNDTLTYNERSNVSKTDFDGRKDSVNYKDTTTEVTTGNIGIATATDMLLKETELRTKELNFYENLFTEIIFDLTW